MKGVRTSKYPPVPQEVLEVINKLPEGYKILYSSEAYRIVKRKAQPDPRIFDALTTVAKQ